MLHVRKTGDSWCCSLVLAVGILECCCWRRLRLWELVDNLQWHSVDRNIHVSWQQASCRRFEDGLFNINRRAPVGDPLRSKPHDTDCWRVFLYGSKGAANGCKSRINVSANYSQCICRSMIAARKSVVQAKNRRVKAQNFVALLRKLVSSFFSQTLSSVSQVVSYQVPRRPSVTPKCDCFFGRPACRTRSAVFVRL